MTNGEEAMDREGYSFSRRLSTRRRGRVDKSASRGREPFSITRHFERVGLRWPSPPEGMGGKSQFDVHRSGSASLGRSRGNRRQLHRMERSRGSTARGGHFSWSPPRTRTGTGPSDDFPTATAVGSSSGKLLGPESREDEQGRRSYINAGDGEHEHHGQWTASCSSDNYSSDGGVGYHRRPVSPLMLPLDPYRGSRTVRRAGTVVSRRDAAAAEQSSRRAALSVRRASEARALTEGHGTTLASSRERDQLSRRQWRRWRRQTSGSDGSLSDDRGDGWTDGWTTSGTLLDIQEDERWRDRIRHFLPSVENMGRELEAIRRADEAMREEQLAQVRNSGSFGGVCYDRIRASTAWHWNPAPVIE